MPLTDKQREDLQDRQVTMREILKILAFFILATGSGVLALITQSIEGAREYMLALIGFLILGAFLALSIFLLKNLFALHKRKEND